MSSMRLICIGLLLLSVANGDNKGVRRRSRRSLVRLKSMLETLTDTHATDFLNYGNYCGLGGSGDPVDPIDGCCQSHDYCYDEVQRNICPNDKQNAIYTKHYNWNQTEKGFATCGKNIERCAFAVCLCDVVLINCLKSNLHFYNTDNFKQLSLFDMIQQGNQIATL